jgi:hypothetical protein
MLHFRNSWRRWGLKCGYNRQCFSWNISRFRSILLVLKELNKRERTKTNILVFILSSLLSYGDMYTDRKYIRIPLFEIFFFFLGLNVLEIVKNIIYHYYIYKIKHKHLYIKFCCITFLFLFLDGNLVYSFGSK